MKDPTTQTVASLLVADHTHRLTAEAGFLRSRVELPRFKANRQNPADATVPMPTKNGIVSHVLRRLNQCERVRI